MKHLLTLSALCIACLVISQGPLFGQYLISSEFLGTNTAAQADIWDGVPNYYDVANYKLVYNTVDVHGDPTIASGLLVLPLGTACDSLPMLVYCHGTVLQKFDVPSSAGSGSSMDFASSGFIVAAPDYLGLGDSPGLHPYMHAESEATATIDMVHAAREFLQTAEVHDNGELFVTGYSQGGHAAMATLKYAEEDGLTQDLGIVAGAPMSGAYDESGTMAPPIIFEQVNYSFMGYVAWVVLTDDLAYDNLFDELSEYFIPPYDGLIADWFDGAQNTTSISEVNNALPNTLSGFVVDSVIQNMQNNPDHPIWADLQANDIYDWTPQIPLRMYYCQSDEQVYYLNSVVADSVMNANGAPDVQAIDVLPSGSHAQCQEPAFSATYAFFHGLADMCSPLGVGEQHREPLAFFPNPASNSVTVHTAEGIGTYTLYDQMGRTVLQGPITGVFSRVDVSKLPSGTYQMEVRMPNGIWSDRLMVCPAQ